MSELQRLRDRVQQLEELLGLDRSLRGRLRDVFGISNALAETLGLMVSRSFVTHDALYIALYGGRPECDWPEINILDVQITRLRRILHLHGIAIKNKWGEGWMICPADRARIRAMVAESEDAIEVPNFLIERAA